jgi:hypothetical protein
MTALARKPNMNDYSEKYKVLPFEPVLSRYRRARTCEFIETKDIDLWVEVGCGTQPLPNLVEGRRWIVVEPAAEFRALVTPVNATTYAAVGDVPPVAERCGIIIDSLLHEVPDPVGLLRAYGSIFTHPENIYRINVPNALSFHRQIANGMGLIDSLHDVSATGHHLQQPRVYRPESLQLELESAGLEVLELTSSFPKLFTNGQLQAIIDHGIVDELVFLAMDTLDASLGLAGAELVAVCRKH